MMLCSLCNTPYPDETILCVRDGAMLAPMIEVISEKSAAGVAGILDLTGAILGNYKLQKRLGAGGMGAVYQATHISIKKEVAVKILLSNTSDAALLERFHQEAEAVAQINQENIVQIMDFGCDPGGRAYLVMELLPGKSLSNVLDEERRLPPRRALQIAIQICHGLDAAHAQKIIHRDLKPDNILLVKTRTNPEHVKIIDFGIAKKFGGTQQQRRLTSPHQVIGTAPYMSPEQIKDAQLDVRTDIYTLGVILYEMVTGVLPFDGANNMDILCKHLSEAPTPPSRHTPVPPAVEAVILQAMEKNREKRFPTMLAFASALEACLKENDATQPVEPPTLTLETPALLQDEPPPQKTKQKTTLSTAQGEVAKAAPRKTTGFLLGAVFSVAVGGAALFWWNQSQKEEPRITTVQPAQTPKPEPEATKEPERPVKPVAPVSTPVTPQSQPQSAPVGASQNTPQSAPAVEDPKHPNKKDKKDKKKEKTFSDDVDTDIN